MAFMSRGKLKTDPARRRKHSFNVVDLTARPARSSWAKMNNVVVQLLTEEGLHYRFLDLTEREVGEVLPVLFENATAAAKRKEVKGYLATLDDADLIALAKEVLAKRG